jgi:hypothetical protein
MKSTSPDCSPASHETTACSELDFASLEQGRRYGVHHLEITRELVETWCGAYGLSPPSESMPMGMMSVLSIRTYMALMPRRPPGGVHAGQTFVFQEMPRIGERLSITLQCASKEERGGRLWVKLLMEGAGSDGRPLFNGVHVALWAR